MALEETVEKYGLYLGISITVLALIFVTIIKTASENTIGMVDKRIAAVGLIGLAWVCGLFVFDRFEYPAWAGHVLTAVCAVVGMGIWFKVQQSTVPAVDNQRQPDPNIQLNDQGTALNDRNDQVDGANEHYKLTDTPLWNLAQVISNPIRYESLGRALNLADHHLESIQYNDKNEIILASHKMLKRWRQGIEDSHEQWKQLVAALKKADLGQYIPMLKQ